MKEVLTEAKAEAFLSKWLPVARSILAKKREDAQEFSQKTGFPVVLKIISPQALHKTDVGGVKIAKDLVELTQAFNDLERIAKQKKLHLEGILAQEFIKGNEVIIGIKKDVTFGHAIMLGLGGVFVEILKDVSFRVCPITLKDAQQMIDELKAKQVLYGARGAAPVNIALLKKTLVAVSELAVEHPEITELDINPFIVNEKDGKIADARIVLEK